LQLGKPLCDVFAKLFENLNCPTIGTNQSGASDDTDSENLKLGAFAAKRDILSRKISGIAGVKDEVRLDENGQTETQDVFFL